MCRKRKQINVYIKSKRVKQASTWLRSSWLSSRALGKRPYELKKNNSSKLSHNISETEVSSWQNESQGEFFGKNTELRFSCKRKGGGRTSRQLFR